MKVTNMSNTERSLAALALFLILTGPAYAYIDPSSGSMVLQGIIAGIAAIAVTAKLWWHRLLVLLGIRKRTLKPGAGPEAGQGEKKP
jgi:hypothetical protein